MSGPKHRYLERQATYQVAISNPGTAPAQQVELVAYLPSGLKFVSANNSGHYEQADRAVHWRLEELPTNEQGVVELVTMPVEPGQQSIKLRGTAAKGVVVEKEQPVVIDGIAAVLFQVERRTPIRSKWAARPLRDSRRQPGIEGGLERPPDGALAAGIEGRRRGGSHAGTSSTAAASSSTAWSGWPPRPSSSIACGCRACKPGDLRVRCQLLTDDMQTPVTKEEGTQVYADQ